MDEAMREIRRLRRSAWLWRGAGLLAVAWAMFRPVGAIEPQRGERRVADVERVVIRDGQGRVRAVLGCWSDSIILDGKIQPVADSTVGLKLFGKKDPEDPQASFTARQDGIETLHLGFDQGSGVFIRDLAEGPEVSLIDGRKAERARLGLGHNGDPWLSLMDANDQSRFQVGINPGADQTPAMDVFDAKGTTIPILGKDGRPIR